jgi:hypothetical protein
MGFLQQITSGGNIIPGVDNPFQSGQTVWLPGAGGLNPLNSQSAVGQLTKDLGALNPYNPDSVAGKVVDNIGKDMAKDPAKWVAIAACIATGQVQFIPYINAIATVTSKETSPEDWLKEGAKAYVISAGGEWVQNNVTGVGPQTDITTGETFAGTGASGAMNSAKAGAVAGNISKNIFATAARKGSTDINSAQIVTGAITSEALNEAFKFMPGFDGLTKGEQSATVNAFKTAFNKDSNAAYQLFNQGFDATIKGLNDAAKAIGYKDLNHQNAVNNFVQDQGSTEDIDAFNKVEQNAQDKYDNYVAFQDKQKAFNDAQKEYIAAQADANYAASILNGRKKIVGPMWQDRYNAAVTTMNAANKTMADNYEQPEVLQWAEGEYVNARAKALDQNVVVNTYINQGWDNLAQQKEAAAAGFTTPEAYDTYLTDKKAAEQADMTSRWQKAMEEDAANAEAAARQAAIDEQNRLDAAEAERKANDEAERLRQAGLREQSDREAAEAAQVEADRLAKEKADSEALARQAAIDEQNRLDEVERLRQAGLQEKTDVDLNKVVAGGDTTDEDAEQAKRVAEFGKDLTGGGNQDLGETDTDTDFYGEDSTGMGAYKYDPTSGTYTYTSDDGSTLTLDADGNIVGSTEATDTSWTGLTDTATGNLNLPKLPSGKLPAVKPPAKKVTTTKPTSTTTTTGTGNTAVTTGSGTAVQTGGGLNIGALMAIMGGLGGNQQPQQPQIETYDPGKGFEYFDWESDPFAPKTKDKTNPTGQPKMAGGGSIDELLEILRRGGV